MQTHKIKKKKKKNEKGKDFFTFCWRTPKHRQREKRGRSHPFNRKTGEFSANDTEKFQNIESEKYNFNSRFGDYNQRELGPLDAGIQQYQRKNKKNNYS